jgi:outer membrane protein assembly factor BamB
MGADTRRRITAVLGTLSVVAALAACGSKAPSGPAPTERVVSAAAGSPSPVDDTDWPTYHHDAGRTGMATGFAAPGTAAVAWNARLDGAVYGQPLVVHGAVYVATEHDTVYRLDRASGAVTWQAHLGTPVPRKNLPCGNIDPLGITSTMVFDPATGLLFALAESTGAHHTLFGLDPATGAVTVTRAAEPPQGEPVANQQRGALTVYQGRVYVPYGGLAGDCGPYIGSVVSIPTVGNGAVRSYAIPTTREAGIWAPGGGTVQGGRLIFADGNGEQTSGDYDGSDSVVSLSPDLQLTDRFTPTTWPADNAADLDLGSMTPAVVGDYVFITGKRGTGYTMKLSHFGGIGGQADERPVCGGYGGGAVDGNVVFVPCADGTRAVRVDGSGHIQVLWHADQAGEGSPVVGGGVVWSVNYDRGVLYLLDEVTGAVKQKLSVGTAPHFASATLSAGMAFLGTVNGVVAVKSS